MAERRQNTLPRSDHMSRGRSSDWCHVRCHASDCSTLSNRRSPSRFSREEGDSGLRSPYRGYNEAQGNDLHHRSCHPQPQQLSQQQPGPQHSAHQVQGPPTSSARSGTSKSSRAHPDLLGGLVGPSAPDQRYYGLEHEEFIIDNSRVYEVNSRPYCVSVQGSQISLSSGYYSQTHYGGYGQGDPSQTKPRAATGAPSPARIQQHSTPQRERKRRQERGGSVSSSSDVLGLDLDRSSLSSGLERISLASSSQQSQTLERLPSTWCGQPHAQPFMHSQLDPLAGHNFPQHAVGGGLTYQHQLLEGHNPQAASSTNSTPKLRHRQTGSGYRNKTVGVGRQNSVQSGGEHRRGSYSRRGSVAGQLRPSQLVQSEPPSPVHTLSECDSTDSYNPNEKWDREEATAGCCTISQQGPSYSALSGNNQDGKPPIVSNCVKSFMSWMASKAEKSTAAILDSLPSLSREDYHVVMIGLDGAGKTTALYRLKFDQYINTVPTIGFNCERIKGTVGKSRGLTFLIWDVGGQEKIRPLWRSYTRCTDGIIFVVDSSDSDMFEEAKIELFRTMRYQDNASVPLLVLANKQDLPSAASPAQVEESLGLRELNSALWQVEPSCSITGDGLDTALEQLQHLILKRRKIVKRNRNKTR